MKTVLAIGISLMSGLVLGGMIVPGTHAQGKPPVYFIVENEINDVQNYLELSLNLGDVKDQAAAG